MPYLRIVALNKRLNIQRRLAWSLCKDDTHNRREAKPFFWSNISPSIAPFYPTYSVELEPKAGDTFV
ncbi:hypothetical protein ACHAXM_009629 [Skeletonema potamos]